MLGYKASCQNYFVTGVLLTLVPGPRPMQSLKAAWTVQKTVGAVQASWNDSAGGLRTTRSAGTCTAEPRQPGAMPMTESPVVRVVTSAGLA